MDSIEHVQCETVQQLPIPMYSSMYFNPPYSWTIQKHTIFFYPSLNISKADFHPIGLDGVVDRILNYIEEFSCSEIDANGVIDRILLQ